VRVSKRIVNEYRDWPGDERWQRQNPIIGEAFDSPDAREGASAFAEKRKPNWTGH
jgi:enoyl-CoA hydratase